MTQETQAKQATCRRCNGLGVVTREVLVPIDRDGTMNAEAWDVACRDCKGTGKAER